LSTLKEEQVTAASALGPYIPGYDSDKATLLADLQEALFAFKIVLYTQGYMLMRAASEDFGWNLTYGNIALMWRGGCIIRAASYLGILQRVFQLKPQRSRYVH
jgi:6-phosphogluconate dehydrogenase